ncbi:MAG: D-TA family PLP-dependent enzyme [Cyclobacteriaceae bacterium]|nr:D-TA family PLP-dependent enzyme [Cyclobacteriaceae bacterium]
MHTPTFTGIEEIDSPAIIIEREKVEQNIDNMIRIAGSATRLRPHVKTYKMVEIVQMQLDKGIKAFKCATIAEAEMLAMAGAGDILLAHQPTLQKASRLRQLIHKYPEVRFSALVDNLHTIAMLSSLWTGEQKKLPVFIDIDNGNHRSGIQAELAEPIAQHITETAALQLMGLHVYDGHTREPDPEKRKSQIDIEMEPVIQLRQKLQNRNDGFLELIAGGSPSFPVHALYPDRICSPGTTLLWDYGYAKKFPDMPFVCAAWLLTRVISTPGSNLICLDLGHKSVAAENPIENRVFFPDLPDAKPLIHSEEHLVLQVHSERVFKTGDALLGIPHHICPTVALHDYAWLAEEGKIEKTWEVIARKRKINF